MPDRAKDRIRPAREVRARRRAGKIKLGPIFVRVNKAGQLQDQLDGGSAVADKSLRQPARRWRD